MNFIQRNIIDENSDSVDLNITLSWWDTTEKCNCFDFKKNNTRIKIVDSKGRCFTDVSLKQEIAYYIDLINKNEIKFEYRKYEYEYGENLFDLMIYISNSKDYIYQMK